MPNYVSKETEGKAKTLEAEKVILIFSGGFNERLGRGRLDISLSVVRIMRNHTLEYVLYRTTLPVLRFLGPWFFSLDQSAAVALNNR